MIDLIILGIVVLGGWNGYRLGLFRQITRLFGAVIAYIAALWLRPYLMPVVSQMLHSAQAMPSSNNMLGAFLGNLSGAISFTVLFLVSFFILRYAAGLIDALFSLPILSTVNRTLGMVAGLILAVLFVYVGSLIAHYINNPRLQADLGESAIIQWLDAQPGMTIGDSGQNHVVNQLGNPPDSANTVK